MSLNMRRDAIRFWGLPAISALATILVAATVDPSGTGLGCVRCLEKSDRDWLKTFRNSTLSIHQTSNGPSAISTAGSTSSTRRGRPSISRHFAAITTGSISLPETKQDELKEKATRRTDGPDQEAGQGPPGSARPRPRGSFNLSTWETIRPSNWRRSIRSGNRCRRPSGNKSRKCRPGLGGKSLFGRRGEKKNRRRELKRQDFDEAKWITELEACAENHKTGFFSKNLKTKDDARPGEILRRQAINFHFL